MEFGTKYLIYQLRNQYPSPYQFIWPTTIAWKCASVHLPFSSCRFRRCCCWNYTALYKKKPRPLTGSWVCGHGSDTFFQSFKRSIYVTLAALRMGCLEISRVVYTKRDMVRYHIAWRHNDAPPGMDPGPPILSRVWCYHPKSDNVLTRGSSILPGKPLQQLYKSWRRCT